MFGNYNLRYNHLANYDTQPLVAVRTTSADNHVLPVLYRVWSARTHPRVYRLYGRTFCNGGVVMVGYAPFTTRFH